MKYDRSQIFKNAWNFVKSLRLKAFGLALKRAWAEAKAKAAFLKPKKEEKRMVKVVENGERIELYTPYSAQFVSEIKSIGGAKWSPRKSCWTIPAEALDIAKKIMLKIYGEDGEAKQPTLTVRITFEEDQYGSCEAYSLFGKTIARATGRDSGAWPGDGAVFEAGSPSSGGSVKNWMTKIPAGSVVRLSGVSMSLWEEFKAQTHEGIKAEVVEDKIDREALEAEKEKLLKRIAEINQLLK